ncbi:UNVERIFIED_CONTAM: SAGA-associated factor 29A [Sesamum angustifolium]|uniref:SAGA-associated factor 29A n=1 Tax=Sesamum angustifolium TaxID=2727405 RepID=A0AAW2NMA3_9LAMI
MSSPDIAGILDNSKELDRLRKEQEEVLTEINKMHKKLQSTPEVVEKPGDNSLSRLKMLYIQAKDLSESEVTISSQLLGQLDALMPSGTQGQHRRRIEGSEHKKKRMKADSEIPRQSPSVRSHLESLANLKGEQVAARVIKRMLERMNGSWLKFEVLDEEPGDDEESTGQSYILEFDDDEEDGSLPQRSVPFHRVVPLPEGYRQ